MADTDNAIRLVEGEKVDYLVTVKRGGVAVNLADHIDNGTVLFYGFDDSGTTHINGLACEDSDKANGVVLVPFTTTETAIPGSGTDFRGKWRLKLTDSAGDIEKTKKEDLFIERDSA